MHHTTPADSSPQNTRLETSQGLHHEVTPHITTATTKHPAISSLPVGGDLHHSSDVDRLREDDDGDGDEESADDFFSSYFEEGSSATSPKGADGVGVLDGEENTAIEELEEAVTEDPDHFSYTGGFSRIAYIVFMYVNLLNIIAYYNQIIYNLLFHVLI